jgi:hypothetical protein
MSHIWTQKEVELNHKELTKKEHERKKVEAQLEFKHNLNMLFYDQMSPLYAILLVYQ